MIAHANALVRSTWTKVTAKSKVMTGTTAGRHGYRLVTPAAWSPGVWISVKTTPSLTAPRKCELMKPSNSETTA